MYTYYCYIYIYITVQYIEHTKCITHFVICVDTFNLHCLLIEFIFVTLKFRS